MAINSVKGIPREEEGVECGIERTTPEKERAAVKGKGKGQLAEENAEQKITQPKSNAIKQNTDKAEIKTASKIKLIKNTTTARIKTNKGLLVVRAREEAKERV